MPVHRVERRRRNVPLSVWTGPSVRTRRLWSPLQSFRMPGMLSWQHGVEIRQYCCATRWPVPKRWIPGRRRAAPAPVWPRTRVEHPWEQHPAWQLVSRLRRKTRPACKRTAEEIRTGRPTGKGGRVWWQMLGNLVQYRSGPLLFRMCIRSSVGRHWLQGATGGQLVPSLYRCAPGHEENGCRRPESPQIRCPGTWRRLPERKLPRREPAIPISLRGRPPMGGAGHQHPAGQVVPDLP